MRLQLSRRKGFNLQELSLATNGLPAVNVARPGKWGNPFVIYNEEGYPLAIDSRDGSLLGTNLRWREAYELVVAKYKAEITDGLRLEPLRGKNLACWCPEKLPDGSPCPCHADVLLDLANPPSPNSLTRRAVDG